MSLRHLPLLLVLLSSPMCLLAQMGEEPHLGERRDSAQRKLAVTIDVGVIGWRTTPDLLELRPVSSIGVNTQLHRTFSLVEDRFEFWTGLGLGLESYKFQEDLILTPGGDSLQAQRDPRLPSDSIDYRKSKLSVTYVELPLSMHYIGKSRLRPFRVSLEVKPGLLISQTAKRKLEVNNEIVKEKTKGDFHVLPFRLTTGLRVGWGSTTLYGSYSLTPFFQPDEGPVMNTWMLGVSLLVD